ncbi:MAG: hypothetical protein FJY56_09040 [Betaproteobacteria bacterium]|nr:hypothetical protein [Betaproteobacteria bacterium]
MRVLRSRLYESERALSAVPRWVLALFMAALLLHGALRFFEARPVASAAALGSPLPGAALRVLSLGEPQLLSQALSLYLQAFDNQPGISIPYASLDYARVTEWLRAALLLDPAAQYPLMMASRLYGQVNDEPRQRIICEFVHREFLARPNQRWRWLAHCAIMARHRLKDMPLALRYAEAITQHAGQASGWARQMRIFLLEDMGEVERARILLGGLLAGNEVSDPKELNFLTEQLEKLKKAE